MKKVIFILLIIIFTQVMAVSNDKKIDILLSDDSETMEMLLDKKIKKVNEQKKDVTIIKIEGQTFIKYDGVESWIQVDKSTMIKEKSSLITMEKSGITLKMKNDTILDVGEKTKIFLEDLKMGVLKEDISETGIQLLWGKVYSNIKRKLQKGGKFEVKTKGATAGVRGTQFIVYAEKNGDTKVDVFKGLVALEKIGSSEVQLIEAGKRLEIRNGVFGTIIEHGEKAPPEVKEELGEQSKEEKGDAVENDNKEKEEKNKQISDIVDKNIESKIDVVEIPKEKTDRIIIDLE